jgi:hypothetical protein
VVEQPFPHIILKPHWADKALREIAAEFPSYDDERWTTYPGEQQRGKKCGDKAMWGPATRAWFDYVRSPTYLAYLTGLTGIEGLVADTWGGGMHCTGEGGRLAMHTDFSVHPQYPLHTRRLNMLTFLNPEWEPSWGGMLYLGAKREIQVLPLLNTTVIFETSAQSFHGHPDPVAGPHLRKSLAVYFYAPRRPEDELLASTVWQ